MWNFHFDYNLFGFHLFYILSNLFPVSYHVYLTVMIVVERKYRLEIWDVFEFDCSQIAYSRNGMLNCTVSMFERDEVFISSCKEKLFIIHDL